MTKSGTSKGWVRIVTMLTLVAGGWLFGHDLDTGNLPVAGGVAVICVGVVIGFNRQLKKDCRSVGPAEMERLSQANKSE